MHVVNLDPAAEEFKYPLALDVRELISLEDVMEEMQLGPNGGLLYCMEYLEDSLEDWLHEVLNDYGDDDYLIFDCPGQIELYSHVSVFPSLVKALKLWDFRVCCIYALDVHFVNDTSKFISGTMQVLSALVLLELPHVSILTKMDTVQDKKNIESFLDFDARLLAEDLHQGTNQSLRKLNDAVAQLVDDYSMVSFVPLDLSEEESIIEVLSLIDHAIQYGEDLDVKIPDDIDTDHCEIDDE